MVKNIKLSKNKRVVLFLLLNILCLMSTSGQSYVKTTTYLDADSIRKTTNVQYYDGLGRPYIYVSNGVNPNSNSVYFLKEYDGNGRMYREWLPGVSTGNDCVYQQAETCQNMAVSANQDISSFQETQYDELNRPISTMGAGSVWRDNGKYIQKSYGTNTENEVKRYKVTMPGYSISQDGFCPAGSLVMEKTVDEDGKAVQTYKDVLDRIVMERHDTLETYYVYNDANQLCYVLTPEYQKSGIKDRFAYQYRYNKYGRLEKKILPHSDYEQYYYDTEGRVVYLQNPTLRNTNLHRFTLYDKLGRKAIVGDCYNFNYHHYTDVTLNEGQNGLMHTGYTCDYPNVLSVPHAEEVNYYDDYRFLDTYYFVRSPLLMALIKPSHANAAGLKTGMLVRASNMKPSFGGYQLVVFYYDELGRINDVRNVYPDGTLCISTTTYSFTNEPLVETVSLTRNGVTYTIAKEYSYYEANDQLMSISLSYNGNTPVVVAEYEYDDFGQVKKVIRGGYAGNVEYDYNLKGWVTGIQGKGFKEWLHYTDGIGSPCYNGNISSQLWQADNEGFKRGYTFSYDPLNRMRKAEYGEDDNLTSHKDRYSEWVMEYTMNSAIRKLERYGKKGDGNYGKIDNLRMYYTGMQIDSIKEYALPVNRADAFDFVSKTVEVDGAQYGYYEDGALKWDANKGIALITYGNQGYPKCVQFTNGNEIEYFYGADGVKWGVIYRTAVPNINIPIGSMLPLSSASTLATDTIRYFGNYIMKNGQLVKYLFEGGYASFSNNQPVFHYYTCDHLGNCRAVVNHSGAIEQITHYYPFGAIFADVGINDSFQRYKYNGKELDRMHGINFYDYGARMYDPLLGQFTKMDPLAEKYYSVQPYAYCLNNPISMIDKNGKEPTYEEAARIAAHVYGDREDDFLIGNWYPSLKNFHLINKYGLKSQVYERRDENGEAIEYVYATAGTDISDMHDLTANVLQILGASKQHKYSVENARRISKLLKDKELNYVGHSLGGGEAALNSLITNGEGKGRKAFTYNSAGISLITLLKEGGLRTVFRSEKSINAFIVITDPLNYLQKNSILPQANGNKIYVKPQKLNGHSIDNFIFK